MSKLKQIMTGALGSVLLFATPAAVLAETTTTTDSGTPTDTTQTDTTKPPTAEEAARKAAELKKRLEENKAKLKTKVDEAAKKRIIAKCKPAQNIVKGAETSANAISTNRGKAYAKISERVQALIDKLKTAGIDTTELEAAHLTAKTKAETLSASMKAYEQTLADLRGMDCVTDPTGFAATLETARAQRETIKTQANDLRTYISTTLKAAIQKVKAALEAQKPESTDTTTGGGTQ